VDLLNRRNLWNQPILPSQANPSNLLNQQNLQNLWNL
jgi:hypothetical protein